MLAVGRRGGQGMSRRVHPGLELLTRELVGLGPPGVTALNPVCGARHQEIERHVADLLGQKFHGYVPATVSEPLRHLVPRKARMDWTLTGSDEALDGRVVDDIIIGMLQHGLPWMRDRSALTDLADALSAGEGHGHQTAFRAPVALWLLGQSAAALEHLQRTMAEIGDRDDDAAEQFRAFGAKLAGRIRPDAVPNP